MLSPWIFALCSQIFLVSILSSHWTLLTGSLLVALTTYIPMKKKINARQQFHQEEGNLI